MSKELDELLKRSSSRIEDAKVVNDIVTKFLNLPISEVCKSNGSEKKMVINFVAASINEDSDEVMKKKVADIVSIMSFPEEAPGFWTYHYEDEEPDVNSWTNFLSMALALDIVKNNTNSKITSFTSIDFYAYMKMIKQACMGSVEYGTFLDTYNDICDLYKIKKMEFPAENITLGKVLQQLCSFGVSAWSPGAQELEEYGDFILKTQKSINMILVHALCTKACVISSNGEADE